MPDVIPLDMPATYWRGKAQQALRGGRGQEAVRLYRAALRKHEDNGIRRDLAQAYAELRCIGASDRLYLENLARDSGDADSVYGLARNRSLMGDERTMADLLDLYLRLAPCGEQADRARDILWQLPREPHPPRRMRRAETLYAQALDRQEPSRRLERARLSWKRGRTADAAQLLCQLHMQQNHPRKALRYAMQACDLAPEALNARLLLAAALYQCDMPHACRGALRQAMELCAGMEQAHTYTHCAISLDQADLAAELVERELGKAPASADLMILLALALRAQDAQAERADVLLRAAAELDAENPVPRLLLDMPGGADADITAQLGPVMHQVRWITETLAAGANDPAAPSLHEELVRLMRLPLPGMLELSARLFTRAGDMLGLRMALTENELPPMLVAVILNKLEQAGQPLPCFARAEGRLCLLPQKPRPPYDGDLHDLIRRLLRGLPEGVSLEDVVRRVPSAWKKLPESARRHCAQSADGVWPDAFSAYLMTLAGDAAGARSYLAQCDCPRRTGRAYMQLIRRRSTRNEVYRL